MIKLENLSKKFNLQDHDLLDKIAESLNQKIIGETNNKKIIFLVCLTKDLQRDERLSLIISSGSSAGKSNLLNIVLEIFQKDVIDFTEFTQSYYQRQMSNLNGKIIKLEQMEKTNLRGQVTISNLKHQLSEGKLKIGLSERDETGKWTPKELEIRRDLNKILNLTKAIAFCHCANRKRIRDNNGETQILDQFATTEKVYRYSLIAELDDIKEALEIGKDIFSQTLNKLNKSTMEIITHARELDKEKQGFTSSDMAKVTGLSQCHRQKN